MVYREGISSAITRYFLFNGIFREGEEMQIFESVDANLVEVGEALEREFTGSARKFIVDLDSFDEETGFKCNNKICIASIAGDHSNSSDFTSCTTVVQFTRMDILGDYNWVGIQRHHLVSICMAFLWRATTRRHHFDGR